MEFIQTFLFSDFLGTPAYFWLIFISVVIGLLVLDLGVLHKGQKEIEAKESFILYGGYMAIASAFGAWVWYARGGQSGLEFFTGYLIEQSLAMDNIFVIATVFAFLGIPRIYQHRVLFWGILGVILFRAILIGLGAALVMSFSWILFLFGAFLVFTGLKMFKTSNEKPVAREQLDAEVHQEALPRHRQAARREVHHPPDRPQDRQAGAVHHAAASWRSSSSSSST